MLGGLRQPEFHKFLGRNQLHSFYAGFSKRELTTVAKVKALETKEILAIAAEMNMPPAAVDRLLEVLGKKKKKEEPRVPAEDLRKEPAEPRPPTNRESDASKPTTTTTKPVQNGSNSKGTDEKSKQTASTYYHFKSTDKAEAHKYDAKKVDPNKATKWKAAPGASAWNSGCTFEDRDFTTDANALWEKMMIGFEWPGLNLKIKSFSTTAMDYSIIINRGKVKYIYDMNFTCKWKGVIDGEKVEGTIEMADICADDDDWEFSVYSKKSNPSANTAIALIESSKQLILDKIDEFLSTLKKTYGPSL